MISRRYGSYVTCTVFCEVRTDPGQTAFVVQVEREAEEGVRLPT